MDDERLESLLRRAAASDPAGDDAFVRAVMRRVRAAPAPEAAAAAVARLAAAQAGEARQRRYAGGGALVGSLAFAATFPWDEAGRALLASGPNAWQGVFGSLLVALAVLAAAGLVKPAR